jgi:TatA/E family protein of Tat protein translocase
MFGIGPQELIIIGLLALIIFGPGRLTSMARDLGRFVNEARSSVDELKFELESAGEDQDERLGESSKNPEEGEIREHERKLPPEEESHLAKRNP